MENCYPTPDYYSPSPSSSSTSPYSVGQPQRIPQQELHVAQYAEAQAQVQALPVGYEQVANYQENYQQYNMYYPVVYQVPGMPAQPTPVVQEQQQQQRDTVGEQIDEYLNEMYKNRQPRRGTYSQFQIKELTLRFIKNDKIPIAERTELGTKIGLTQEQIKVWFQNRRYKLKKLRAPTSTEGANKSPVKEPAYKPY